MPTIVREFDSDPNASTPGIKKWKKYLENDRNDRRWVDLTSSPTLNDDPYDIKKFGSFTQGEIASRWTFFKNWFELKYPSKITDASINTGNNQIKSDNAIIQDFNNMVKNNTATVSSFKFDNDITPFPEKFKQIKYVFTNPNTGAFEGFTQKDIDLVQEFNQKTDPYVFTDGFLGTQTLLLRYPVLSFGLQGPGRGCWFRYGTNGNDGKSLTNYLPDKTLFIPVAWGKYRFVLPGNVYYDKEKNILENYTPTKTENLTAYTNIYAPVSNFLFKYNPDIHYGKYWQYPPDYEEGNSKNLYDRPQYRNQEERRAGISDPDRRVLKEGWAVYYRDWRVPPPEGYEQMGIPNKPASALYRAYASLFNDNPGTNYVINFWKNAINPSSELPDNPGNHANTIVKPLTPPLEQNLATLKEKAKQKVAEVENKIRNKITSNLDKLKDNS